MLSISPWWCFFVDSGSLAEEPSLGSEAAVGRGDFSCPSNIIVINEMEELRSLEQDQSIPCGSAEADLVGPRSRHACNCLVTLFREVLV